MESVDVHISPLALRKTTVSGLSMSSRSSSRSRQAQNDPPELREYYDTAGWVGIWKERIHDLRYEHAENIGLEARSSTLDQQAMAEALESFEKEETEMLQQLHQTKQQAKGLLQKCLDAGISVPFRLPSSTSSEDEHSMSASDLPQYLASSPKDQPTSPLLSTLEATGDDGHSGGSKHETKSSLTFADLAGDPPVEVHSDQHQISDHVDGRGGTHGNEKDDTLDGLSKHSEAGHSEAEHSEVLSAMSSAPLSGAYSSNNAMGTGQSERLMDNSSATSTEEQLELSSAEDTQKFDTPRPIKTKKWQDSQGTYLDVEDPTNKLRLFMQIGPKAKITDQALLKAGISAKCLLLPTEGSSEELFENYRRRSHPGEYFSLGRVFFVLWAEPALEKLQSTSHDPASRPEKPGERVYSRVRGFVVIQAGGGYSSCLPITTYGGFEMAKPGFRKSDHSVIHSTGSHRSPHKSDPEESDQELRTPIRVVADDQADQLHERSHLDYSAVYTMDHKLKVRHFGKVHPDSLNALLQHFRDVWSSRSGRDVSFDSEDGLETATLHREDERGSLSAARAGSRSNHLPLEKQAQDRDPAQSSSQPQRQQTSQDVFVSDTPPCSEYRAADHENPDHDLHSTVETPKTGMSAKSSLCANEQPQTESQNPAQSQRDPMDEDSQNVSANSQRYATLTANREVQMNASSPRDEQASSEEVAGGREGGGGGGGESHREEFGKGVESDTVTASQTTNGPTVERLFDTFKKRNRPRDFFVEGRVFLALWSEPTGVSGSTAARLQPEIHQGRYGEPVHSDVRHFVVVREGPTYCTCLAITTKRVLEDAKPDMDRNSFANIHTSKVPPARANKGGTELKPIRVVADDPFDNLPSSSMLDYGREFTVDHDFKVRNFGKVHADSMDALQSRIRELWLDPPAPITPTFPGLSSLRSGLSYQRSRRIDQDFRRGKVFEAFHAEPAGASISTNGVTIFRGKNGQPIFHGRRIFIVLFRRGNYCVCWMITSHGNRGATAPGLIQSEHLIVHSTETPPEPRADELPHNDSSGILRSTLRVHLYDGSPHFSDTTRLNVGKPYVIESNRAIRMAGRVHEESVGTLDSLIAEWYSATPRPTASGLNIAPAVAGPADHAPQHSARGSPSSSFPDSQIYKIVSGAGNKVEEFDSSYEQRSARFYTVGKVFTILSCRMSDPDGADDSTEITDRFAGYGSNGEVILERLLWFVVAKSEESGPLCLRIMSYQGQGVPEGFVKSNHSIVYDSKEAPKAREWEKVSRMDGTSMRPSIRIRRKSRSLALTSEHRLRYDTIYKVLPGVVACEFGDVDEQYMWQFKESVRDLSTPAWPNSRAGTKPNQRKKRSGRSQAVTVQPAKTLEQPAGDVANLTASMKDDKTQHTETDRAFYDGDLVLLLYRDKATTRAGIRKARVSSARFVPRREEWEYKLVNTDNDGSYGGGVWIKQAALMSAGEMD